MHGIIATWRMALEGIEKADAMLKEGKKRFGCDRSGNQGSGRLSVL